MINKEYFLIDENDWVTDKKSVEYKPFWKDQKERCINGVSVGGVWIPGRLYYYINFAKIEIDLEIGSSSFKMPGKPYFRDIDWEIFNKIEEAEKQQKGLILLTGRGAGKSFIGASIVAHTYTFFDNTECVISSEETKYIAPLMQKIDLNLRSVPNQFYKHRIQNDLNKSIWAGWIDNKTGKRQGTNSHILVRNFKNNPMAANGTRPKFHLFEEIGTMKNLKKDFNSSVHCWRNDYGQFAIPFLIGTGGDMEAGKDAIEMFNEPDQYNLVSITDIWETGKQIGLFIPATKAKNQTRNTKGEILELKKPTAISEYLNINTTNECLKDTKILVSDEVLAKSYFEEIRTVKKKASDSLTYLQEVMYNPFIPSEVMIRVGGKRFNPELIKQQIHLLETRYPDIGMPVDIYINSISGRIETKATEKKAIKDFPLRPDQSKEGAIVIYEHPIDNAPFGMYIAGIDPYDHDEAANSPSLGSMFIYKKFSGFKIDSVTDRDKVMGSQQIVAEYTGRPGSADEFYENCRLLLHYYHARAMVENENMGIFQYFFHKADDYLLADTPNFIRDILPNTTVTRTKGVHADPSGKLMNWLLGRMKDYINEEIVKELDEQGKLKRVIQGISRIKSVPLLKEMLAYNDEDAKGNYDRVVAFAMTLGYEQETQNITQMDQIEESDPITYFANTKGIFNPRVKREY